MRIRTAFLTVALLVLGACAGKPLRITCGGFANQLIDLPRGAVVNDVQTDQSWRGTGNEVIGMTDEVLAEYMKEQYSARNSWLKPQLDNLRSLARQQRGPQAKAVSQPVQSWTDRPILLLSGGGQWGAFGASYLREVHARTPSGLPEFRVVTGVSTGAMQSLFFGNWHNPESRAEALNEMYKAYDIDDESEIVKRGGLPTLVSRGAMAQLGPLHERIIERICPKGAKECPVIEAFRTKLANSARAAGDATTNYVLVGLVDAESGNFKYVSLNALVDEQFASGYADWQHRAAECLAGAVLASSAMPAYYQQVQVGDEDGGYHTYIDGGARASVFQALISRAFSPAVLIQAIEAANPAISEKEAIGATTDAGGSIYVIRNGPTNVVAIEPTEKAWSGLTALQRAYAIMVNQSEVNSVAVIRLVQPKGELWLATADGYASFKNGKTRCEKANKDAMFEPDFMKCLFALGKEKAAIERDNGGPWISVSEVDAKR